MVGMMGQSIPGGDITGASGLAHAQSAGAATLFARVVAGSESIAQQAAALEQRLQGVIARAVGPTPTPPVDHPNNRSTKGEMGGHLGALDVRMTAASLSLQRLHTLMDQIEQVI